MVHATCRSPLLRRPRGSKLARRESVTVESTAVSNIKLPPRDIPKAWVTMLRIEGGPYDGQMAHPCVCGYETRVDDPNVALVRWFNTGGFMYVHRDCVQKED